MDSRNRPKSEGKKPMQQSTYSLEGGPYRAKPPLPASEPEVTGPATVENIDLERVVWDPEYREKVRHLLHGNRI
jgi:hypothetical protein